MAYNQITAIYIGNLTNVSIHIERESDGLVYDSSNGQFKPESSCVSPLITLLNVIGLRFGTLRATVNVTLPTFTDGNYTVYFHDNNTGGNPVVSASQITIFGGSTKSMDATDIATRFMNCAIAGTNVRTLFTNIKVKLGI